MKKIKAYVINHGHMDIEWYQPLVTYSAWFCDSLRMLDNIVEKDSVYKCYVYDGVVFPVLYAMNCDKTLKEKIERLIDDKKLKIGPFYTQFDEFLTCGEHIIKNCIWGDRNCRELGAEPMKAGYLLDNFGHPAQLPQILNNFGIKSLFFSRGMCDIGDNIKEFLFCAPDGSKLAAQNFSYGTSFNIYANNDPRPSFVNYLPYYKNEYFTYEYLVDLSKHIDNEGIAKQLIENVLKNAHFYPSGIVPVFVGTDHCPPQEGLTKTLDLANKMQDEIEFVFTDAQELSERLYEQSKNFEMFGGDLIGSKYDRLFFGAMTTRVYLKQMMYDCERNLFDYALPLAAYAKWFGYETTQDILDEATQLLMINSTHDSIHGSSLESVHRENEFRFDRASQLCTHSIHESMKVIARHLRSKENHEEFVVFSPRDYDGYISAWLLTGSNEAEITDADGNIYENVIAPKTRVILNANNQPYYLRPSGEDMREVLFKAKLNAGQVKKFFIRLLDKQICEPLPECKNEISNEFLSLAVADGNLVLTDRETNVNLKGFLKIIEEAEAGDVFDHESTWTETASYDSDMFGFTDICVLNCGLYEQLSAKCTMRVPIETVGDIRSESMVDMPITFKFKLWKGIKRLDINIKIRNHSRNHRVRAVFTFPMEFDSIKANEIFCTEDFSVEHPPITAEWKENPTRELPFRDWISVSDDVHRCTLAAKGLYVFESLDKNSIAFTLFRSVGELMRINVKDREGCCAAGYPVDGAQCLIEMTYDCALFIHSANDSVYDIHRMTEQFILPPAVHPIRRNEEIEADSAFAELFRFIDNKSFAVSVFEQSYDREYFVLRFYEINGEKETAKIDLSCFSRVYMSDMNETIIDELKMNNGIVEIDVQANKVITLMLKK